MGSNLLIKSKWIPRLSELWEAMAVLGNCAWLPLSGRWGQMSLMDDSAPWGSQTEAWVGILTWCSGGTGVQEVTHSTQGPCGNPVWHQSRRHWLASEWTPHRRLHHKWSSEHGRYALLPEDREMFQVQIIYILLKSRKQTNWKQRWTLNLEVTEFCIHLHMYENSSEFMQLITFRSLNVPPGDEEVSLELGDTPGITWSVLHTFLVPKRFWKRWKPSIPEHCFKDIIYQNFRREEQLCEKEEWR